MIPLPPTTRLVLMSLKLHPGQTFDQLAQSTGCRNRTTLRDAIRLTLVGGLATRSDDRPAHYNLTAITPTESEVSDAHL